MTHVDPMVLWGARGHAKVLRECMQHQHIELLAVFDNDPSIPGPFMGVPVYHGEAGLDRWLAGWEVEPLPGFLVAIGGSRGEDRLIIQALLADKGLVPLTAVHPKAVVLQGGHIGTGSQVLAGATVSVEVEIGTACIVNTGAVVDHECVLGDGSHVGPGASLAGCVDVGRCAMVGAGAVVLPRVSIGEGSIVGAGAVVTRDVDPGTVVVGNPAAPLQREA